MQKIYFLERKGEWKIFKLTLKKEVTDALEEVKSNINKQLHVSRLTTPEVVLVLENHEISLKSRNIWKENWVIVDNVFAYVITSNIVNDNEPEP